MIHCEWLSERMPELVRGEDALSPEEQRHLDSCPECSAEWRLVGLGRSLGSDVSVDTARVASAVLNRLHEVPVDVLPLRPRALSWRGLVVGLTAAAASVALTVWVPHSPHAADAVGAVVALGALPELEQLSETELQSVMEYVEPTVTDVTPAGTPRLGDLSEDQLEQLLRAVEGE
jgi:hypothetical protein